MPNLGTALAVYVTFVAIIVTLGTVVLFNLPFPQRPEYAVAGVALNVMGIFMVVFSWGLCVWIWRLVIKQKASAP